MKQSKQPRQPRRRRVRRPSAGRGRSLLQPLIFLLICVALVLGMSVFFRVSKVEVVGNSIYTAEEVVDASGIGKGDNLFFINRFSAASRIFSKLPYVDKAKVTRALPNRVTITIQESSAMAYVKADDGYWVVDQNCKLLKSVTDSELTGLARIDGITPVEPKVGEVLNAGDADAPWRPRSRSSTLRTRRARAFSMTDGSRCASVQTRTSSINSACSRAPYRSSRPEIPAPSICRSTSARISAPAECSQKKIDLIRKTI